MKQSSKSFDLFQKQATQVGKNFRRVEQLLKLSEEVKNGEDVVKAAVVLLHASFEEYLRLTEVEILVTRRRKATDNYEMRVTLLDLQRLRSIADDSELRRILERKRRTYNNKEELEKWLTLLGLSHDLPDIKWDSIIAMMRKRHDIVHKADSSPLSINVVRGWIEAVTKFVARTSAELLDGS